MQPGPKSNIFSFREGTVGAEIVLEVPNKMEDEGGMDPCECIWSQEMAMRRLLSFLRQSQTHCTDIDCVEDFPALPGQQTGDNSAMLMMMMWFVVAIGLFFLRPGALRNNPDTKPADNNNGPGPSGPPPPMAN